MMHRKMLVGLTPADQQAKRERRRERQQQQDKRDKSLSGSERYFVVGLIVREHIFHHTLPGQRAAGGAAAFQFV